MEEQITYTYYMWKFILSVFVEKIKKKHLGIVRTRSYLLHACLSFVVPVVYFSNTNFL